MLKSAVVSKTTIKRRLTDEFGLKAYKVAKKPRLIPFVKIKRFVFAKAHMDWTTEDWRKVYFLMNQLCSSLHLQATGEKPSWPQI